jgi:hypothetical protein
MIEVQEKLTANHVPGSSGIIARKYHSRETTGQKKALKAKAHPL